jgi:hypothetical protein
MIEAEKQGHSLGPAFFFEIPQSMILLVSYRFQHPSKVRITIEIVEKLVPEVSLFLRGFLRSVLG